MKKLAKIIAVSVCAASLFSMTACGGSTLYKTNTTPNWQIRGGLNEDFGQDSYLASYREVARYSITHKGGTNSYYSVEYLDDGSYTTTFYAMEYDWNNQNIPEELRVENTVEYVYVYETELELSGAYVMGGSRHEFTNSVKTVSYFRSAEDNLMPVYSKQDIVCTSPNTLQPSSLESCYVEIDRAYETYYGRDGSVAVTNILRADEGLEEGKITASVSTDHSLFDASSLGIALRSFTQSGTHLIDVYVPANTLIARYQAVWGSAIKISEDNEEYSSIISAMNAAVESGYLLSPTNDEGKREFTFAPVQVSLVSSMAGPTNTYYYAAVTNTDLNAERAALMRVEEVVPFNLGTLVYNLSSLQAKQG